MSLKQIALSGIKWTAIGSITNSVIQLIQLSILSKLLEPTDFGLMAIVMIVIGFSQMFIDMGVSNAIIYKQKVTLSQLNSLYWLGVFIGLILFVIIIFLSPIVARFYNTSELRSLIIIVGITFLIQPFGQQFMVLLQKELQFDKITKSQVIARLLSFFITISLAFNEYGVYSLVWGTVSYSFVSTIIFIYFGSNIYMPKFYFNKSDLNEFISFSLYQMGEKIISYFRLQFDTILIGRLFGLEILGVYDISKNLVKKVSSVINPIITRVTFPILSKINNINKLKMVYLKTINFLSFINFPIYFLILILAEPIVLILFGTKWTQTIHLVQIMSFTFLLRSIGNPAGSLLLSRGKANIIFYWNLTLFLLVPLTIFIGSFWGIYGVVIALLIIQILLLFPVWKIIIYRTCHASFYEYAMTIIKPFLVSFFSGIIALFLMFFIVEIHFKIAIGIIVFLISYAILTYKLQKEFFNELKGFIFN